MNKFFTLLVVAACFSFQVFAQDAINQVIVVNGGQFGNPNEQTNIASFNPTTQEYVVFDTIPTNSAQHVVIEGDFAYVAAQNYIVKYDLDTYERVAIVAFPGISAHQIALSENYVWATNYYAQTANNLYVFNKSDLTIVDTIAEILSSGGTMVIFGESLFISQNEKGAVDACAPFGCYNDTSGYLAEIDINTRAFIQNHTLNNNGNEAGRLVATDLAILSLNAASNSITAFNPIDGSSFTTTFEGDIQTSNYKNEAFVIDNKVISMFNNGIGLLSADLDSATMLVDTTSTSFAFDFLNDEFYITSTDYFSYNDLYNFNGTGDFNYELPIGFAPEAIAIHYNNSPIGTNYAAISEDTVIILINDIAQDVDGDAISGSSIVNAPVNGSVTFLDNGNLMYRSFSVGSGDFFRVEICDDKLNPLCTFINVTISDVTTTISDVFREVSIYPNPAVNQLSIQNEIPNTAYSIYNAQGKVMLNTTSNSINVQDFPVGNYFIRMQLEQNFKTISFIKQ
jgi:hypothetical protein